MQQSQLRGKARKENLFKFKIMNFTNIKKTMQGEIKINVLKKGNTN